MSTESLVLSITEKGALQVKRNIEGIGTGALKASGAMALLKNSMSALMTGAVAVGIVQMVDKYTVMQNRLKLVTRGSEELGAVTDRLFKISENTRSSFTATGEMYARMALASRELGKTQNELLQFTESLNQAIILSGASAQESQAGMIQLSQGLASGALRGDELRAVMEQLPMVADVVAKSLGISRGEFRKMGIEGKISAKIVLDAFEKARVELAEKFAKTVPTVGQSLTVLKNSITGLFGGMATASGTSQAMSKAIISIAKAIPKLMEPMMVLGDTIVSVFHEGGAILQKWGRAMKESGIDLSAVLKNMGLGFLAFLRTVAQIVDKSLGLVVGLVQGIMAAVVTADTVLAQIGKGDFGGAAETMRSGGKLIADSFMQGFNQTNLTTLVDNVIGTVMDNAAKRAGSRKKDVNLDIGIAGGSDQPFGSLGKDAKAKWPKYIQGLRDEYTALKASNEEREITKALLQASLQLEEEWTDAHALEAEAQLRLNKQLGERVALYDQLTAPQREFDQGMKTLEEIKPQIPLALYNQELLRLKENLTNAQPEFVKMMKSLEDQAALLRVSPREAEIQQPLQDARNKMTPDELQKYEIELRYNQAIKDQAALVDELDGAQNQFTRSMDALIEAQRLGIVTQDEFNMKKRQYEAILLDSIGEINMEAEAYSILWDNATASLDNFIETGIFSFRDFSAQILLELEKIIAKMLLMKAFKAIGIPLPDMATGGSFMVGGQGGTDSQLVAFKASPNERVTVQTPGQQMAGQPQPQQSAASPVIKIVNVVNPDDIKDAMGSTEGEQVIMNVIQRNRASVRQAIS